MFNRLQMMGGFVQHSINSLILVINQRLLRRLCDYCKFLAADLNVYQAKGCSKCLQGYTGRIAIYEFLTLTPSLLEALAANQPSTEIYQQIKASGFMSLKEAGLEKVKLGLTSLAELKRVIS